MLITRVELEDIKNYEAGSYEFGPGVTAISGPNGAGKTTIIEAIAWALFDHLPYKKEDFLRRGAKKGSVRITFQSALDGREYTVHRDTSTGYYIYDPVTKFKLVEQKQQVGTWLKQHLGIEAGTDLKSLFTSTIGVPQGTFTVDFAEQPAKRKISFDKVLKVDEYHRSSDDMRALIRLIETREAEIREEIARIEGEVAALDNLLAEQSRYEAHAEQMREALAEAEADRERTRLELERLDQLQRKIELTENDARALATRIEDMTRRQSVITEQVSRARAAVDAVNKAAEGFKAYNEASLLLDELGPKATERDQINKEVSDRERESFQIEASLKSVREKLTQIDSDREEIERLAPLAEEQSRLETRLADLQTVLGELISLRTHKEAVDRELAAFRAEYSDLKKRIEEAESLREPAEAAPRLQQERRDLEFELGESKVALERKTERARELRRVKETIAKLNGEITTIEKDMRAGAEAEAMATGLSQLEAEDQAAMEEIADLRASIEREKKILSRIEGGLCPLLSERCLNMKEGRTLDQYFESQVGTESERLAVVEKRRKEIQHKLIAARHALKAASALEGHRVHRGRYQQELEISRKEAARLESEIEASGVNAEVVRQLDRRLAALDQELKIAQEAYTKYEALGVLRERKERLETEGGERRKNSEQMQARLIELEKLQPELESVRDRLVSLEDPRGRSRFLQQGLSKEPALRDQAAELARREREVAGSIKNLVKRLEHFSGLDQQIATARDRRAANEKDHRLYIENQPIAALLEPREAELKAASDELQEATSKAHQFARDLAGFNAEYDQAKHQTVKILLETLINQAASYSSELSGAMERLAELGVEIDRLTAEKERLTRLEMRKARFGELLSVTEFIRDMLKKAGPFVTEAHLQSISIESNQLYREITGNPMVSLRWDMGYEIVLEEDGHERSFASLSGGEQMAAALSVRLALLKELSDMRIAFFDEPTTNMDEERRRNLAQQIGRIKDFDQLFVISHDDAFEGFTDRVVGVRAAGDGAST